jgi:hypothetical protein
MFEDSTEMFYCDSFSDFSLIDFHRYSPFNAAIITHQFHHALKDVYNFDPSAPNRRVCTETALPDEFKTNQSISEINCKFTTMEEEHRSFPTTGSASTPLPHRSDEGSSNLHISQFINTTEKF